MFNAIDSGGRQSFPAPSVHRPQSLHEGLAGYGSTGCTDCLLGDIYRQHAMKKEEKPILRVVFILYFSQHSGTRATHANALLNRHLRVLHINSGEGHPLPRTLKVCMARLCTAYLFLFTVYFIMRHGQWQLSTLEKLGQAVALRCWAGMSFSCI